MDSIEYSCVPTLSTAPGFNGALSGTGVANNRVIIAPKPVKALAEGAARRGKLCWSASGTDAGLVFLGKNLESIGADGARLRRAFALVPATFPTPVRPPPVFLARARETSGS